MNLLWVIWYRDFWNRCETLDSIWTDKKMAQERKEKLHRQFIDEEFDPDNNFDKYSVPWMAEVRADCEIGLDLDISVERDEKGYQIEKEVDTSLV